MMPLAVRASPRGRIARVRAALRCGAAGSINPRRGGLGFASIGRTARGERTWVRNQFVDGPNETAADAPTLFAGDAR